MKAFGERAPKPIAKCAGEHHQANRSRGDRRRDPSIGEIGSGMKCHAAGADGGKKRAAHEQPERRAAHRLGTTPAPLRGAPTAVQVHRFTPPIRRRGKSVGIQAQIFRLAAQKNESRNNHKHPQGNTQSQKRAAPTVMQNEKLINQRQDR